MVRRIVIADMREDAAVCGLNCMQLVILLNFVARPGRNIRQPSPRLAVI